MIGWMDKYMKFIISIEEDKFIIKSRGYLGS